MLLNDYIIDNSNADERRNDLHNDLQNEQQTDPHQYTDQLRPTADMASEDMVINDDIQQQTSRHSKSSAGSRDESCIPPQFPRPTMSDCETEREVHNIPKARKMNNTIKYSIIYQDQVNKNIGEYVLENKLTKTEKNYIQQHKNDIRIMRHTPKIKINQMYADNDNCSLGHQSKMTNYFAIMI